MPSVIKIKRSEVSGNPAVLGAGELAYSSLPDTGANGGDRLYIGTGTETAGNAVNHTVIGGKYFVDQINSATSNNTPNTLVRRDALGGISAAKWTTARSLTLTGDATASIENVDGSQSISTPITLATVNSSAGTYGSANLIPIVSVNSKGLVTSVTTAEISTALGISGNTGTDTLTLGTDTLKFAGSTGVTTTVTNNQVSFAIGQDVSPTSNVTFNNLNVSGNTIIAGDLTVQGVTTTVNSVEIEIKDTNITLAFGAANAAAANNGGITLAGANASLTYTAVNDRWNLNKDLVVNNVFGNANTATTLATTRAIAATGDAVWSVDFNGSTNTSAPITLATVNTNTGSFGTSTTVPVITVNNKGLITSVSTETIPTATTNTLGVASFDPTQFSVTSGLASISEISGGTY